MLCFKGIAFKKSTGILGMGWVGAVLLPVIHTIILMNLNATKCTFGHSDITSRKQQKEKKLCNMCYRNNTVFVIFELWATR